MNWIEFTDCNGNIYVVDLDEVVSVQTHLQYSEMYSLVFLIRNSSQKVVCDVAGKVDVVNALHSKVKNLLSGDAPVKI